MKRRLFRITVLLLVIFVAGGALVTLAQPPAAVKTAVTKIDFNTVQMESASFGLRWDVTASGGSTISSSQYRLSSTIGQPVVGHFSSPNFSHGAGYWSVRLYRLLLPIIRRN